MNDESLKQRLERVADLAGAGFPPPDAAVFGARRRARRRVRATVVAVVVAVVAVATVTALLPRPAHKSPIGASTARLPPPKTRATSGDVSAAELTQYHWQALPAAPIADRSEGVAAVWTGTRMLIWGGDAGHGSAFADGASYDPKTRTWAKLPSSPLGPRTNPAYTWTGHDLFIWGGSRGGDSTIVSGALYNPGSRSWRRVASLTIKDNANPIAVWTGSRVVLLTTATGEHATTIDAHAYNPATNSWSTLPSIHITQTNLLGVSALVAGDQLYVWAPVQTISTSGLQTGNDGFRYHAASNTWAATALLPTQDQYSVGDALWTGDHIIFQPNGIECTCGGIAGVSTGSWADPQTGTVTAISAWQSEPFASSTFTWTGDAILAVSNGAAAAWNPANQRWTHLPAPSSLDSAAQIWTGTTLLLWGQSAAHSDKGTGLEFTR